MWIGREAEFEEFLFRRVTEEGPDAFAHPAMDCGGLPELSSLAEAAIETIVPVSSTRATPAAPTVPAVGRVAPRAESTPYTSDLVYCVPE